MIFYLTVYLRSFRAKILRKIKNAIVLFTCTDNRQPIFVLKNNIFLFTGNNELDKKNNVTFTLPKKDS